MNPVSNLERLVIDRLASLGYRPGVDYVREARIEGVKGRVDFLFPAKVPAFFDDGRPLKGMILEVDGCYHHDCSSCGYLNDRGLHEQDARKTALLEAAGYYVVRLWGHEVLEDPERVGLILFLLIEQRWGALGQVLDELYRAEDAAIERAFPKRLDLWFRRVKEGAARAGKPVPRKAREIYRSQMAAWRARNPQGPRAPERAPSRR